MQATSKTPPQTPHLLELQRALHVRLELRLPLLHLGLDVRRLTSRASSSPSTSRPRTVKVHQLWPARARARRSPGRRRRRPRETLRSMKTRSARWAARAAPAPAPARTPAAGLPVTPLAAAVGAPQPVRSPLHPPRGRLSARRRRAAVGRPVAPPRRHGATAAAAAAGSTGWSPRGFRPSFRASGGAGVVPEVEEVLPGPSSGGSLAAAAAAAAAASRGSAAGGRLSCLGRARAGPRGPRGRFREQKILQVLGRLLWRPRRRRRRRRRRWWGGGSARRRPLVSAAVARGRSRALSLVQVRTQQSRLHVQRADGDKLAGCMRRLGAKGVAHCTEAFLD